MQPLAEPTGAVSTPEPSAPAVPLARPDSRSSRIASRVVAGSIFAAFLLYYGLLCFRHEGWGGDFQAYCAGVSQLYRDFVHPLHEAMNAPGTESTLYTLYLVVVAASGKVLGLTPYAALEVAGLVNLLIFAGAIGYFFSRQSAHRRWELSAACFLFVHLFLRWRHFGWSSDTSLTSLQYVQPFPSTFAWALAFVAFALLSNVEKERSLASTLALAGVVWLLILTHVITASWVMGIVGLDGLVRSLRQRNIAPLARAAGVLVVAVAFALPWPYASFFGQSSFLAEREGSTFGRSPFVDFPNLYLVAIPACAYLVLRLRRHGFWMLGGVATLAALGVWRALDISYGNRYAFFAAFFAQFMVAEVMVLGIFSLGGSLSELPRARPSPWLDRPVSIAVLAGACLSWLPSPMIAQSRDVPKLGSLMSPGELLNLPAPDELYYRQFADLRPFLSRADVVMTPESRAVFDLASITGAQVVSSPHAMRVPDRDERARDVSRFFDHITTRADRRAIVQRYGITKVVLPGSDDVLLGALTELFGEPIFRDHAFAVLSTAGAVKSGG